MLEACSPPLNNPMPVSHSEFLAMQERCARGQRKSTPPITGGESKESNLHEKIIEECKRNGWIYLHGSMAHRSMRTLGETDFHCLLPRGVILHIECKTASGKLSPEQLAMKVFMEHLGHSYHIVRSFIEFKELCRKSLITKDSNSKMELSNPDP